MVVFANSLSFAISISLHFSSFPFQQDREIATMLLLRRISLLFLFLLELSLAAFVAVQQDTGLANRIGSQKALVWTSVLTFDQEVTEQQLTGIARDGFISMLENLINANMGTKWLPKIMTALTHEDPKEKGKWIVYLSSSTRSKDSLVYEVSSADRNAERCGKMRSLVPQQLQDTFSACQLGTGHAQHQNDANCGETGVLLLMAARTGDAQLEAARKSKVVAWKGTLGANKAYESGRIEPPCPLSDRGFGCANTLDTLAKEMTIVSTEEHFQDSDPNDAEYTNNMPTNVEFLSLYPEDA